MRTGLIIGLLVAATAAPAASASGDRALSVAARYATVTTDDDGESGRGAAVGLDYERGVSDAVTVRGSVQGAIYPSLDGDDTDPPAYCGQATVGLVYALDVIKYVPFVGIAAGGAVVAGGGKDTDVFPLVELSAGIDILHSRSLSYGVGIRFAGFATDAQFLTVGARVTWRWGFF